MGMSAEVLAIGPFRRSLVPFLEHPAGRYTSTREGATLVQRVFHTPEGSSRSRQLAECLGVEPWDFNTHALDPWRVNLEALRELLRPRACPEHRVTPAREPCAACLHPVDTFVALREAGFSFFFLPNG